MAAAMIMRIPRKGFMVHPEAAVVLVRRYVSSTILDKVVADSECTRQALHVVNPFGQEYGECEAFQFGEDSPGEGQGHEPCISPEAEEPTYASIGSNPNSFAEYVW
jgi:hypothetical protein